MWQIYRGLTRHRETVRARRSRRGSTRLGLDFLESRTLLSSVTWTGSADGKSWAVADNWSDDAVPTSSDDVTINLSGNPTIQITSGAQAVNSLTSTDPISISGGSLSVAADSTMSGGLTMTGGSLTASGTGVTLSVSGTTTVSAASLYAESGATLSLPQLTSYSNPSGSNSNYFQATGTGATVNLPALTNLGSVQNWLYVEAKQGGQVLLPALDALASNSSYVQFDADGSGSKIDLSALTSLPVANSGDLSVTNQATVLDPKLTSLTNVAVTLDGTGTIATSQWASLTRDSLTITGGTYSFPGITDFDASERDRAGRCQPDAASLDQLQQSLRREFQLFPGHRHRRRGELAGPDQPGQLAELAVRPGQAGRTDPLARPGRAGQQQQLPPDRCRRLGQQDRPLGID